MDANFKSSNIFIEFNNVLNNGDGEELVTEELRPE